MKWLTVLLTIHTLLLGTPATAAEKFKFAYVDVPRAIASSEAAMKAREILQKKLETKQREVDLAEEEIKKLKEEKLQEEKDLSDNVLKADHTPEISAAMRKKVREYQRLVEDHQAALDRENGLWTKKITDALRDVVQEIGREEGYIAIFGKGQVLFASSAIDITDKVLTRLNEYTRKWY